MRTRGRMAVAGAAFAVAIFAIPAAAMDTAYRYCGDTTDSTVVLVWDRSTTDVTLSNAERTAECDRLMKAATPVLSRSEIKISATSSSSSSSTPAPAVPTAFFADEKWIPE